MIKKLFEKYSALRYVLSSVAAFVVDNGLYYVFLHFVFPIFGSLNAVMLSTISQVAARVLSSFFNFNCNHHLVFKSSEKYSSALLKYYCLCIPQAAVSVILLDVLIANVYFGSDFIKMLVKIVIEGILFVISYLIQNKWVFAAKNGKEETLSDD